MRDDDDDVDRLIQCVKCFVPKMSKSQIVQAFSETSKSQIVAAFSKMFKSQIVHAFSKLILYLVVVKIIFILTALQFREPPPPPLKHFDLLVNYSKFGSQRLSENDTINVSKSNLV